MASAQDETQNLIAKAKLGDKEALNTLFARYQERVLRIVRLRLGSELRPKLQSMDIVQEVFLSAFQKLKDFEMSSEGVFVHWLSKIVENRIRDYVDHFKTKKRTAPGGEIPLDKMILEEADGDGVRFEPPGDDTTPSQFVIRQERKNTVDTLLCKLKSDERDVIIHRDLEGLSFKEIGEILNKSEDAARKHYQRAFQQLIKLAEKVLPKNG